MSFFDEASWVLIPEGIKEDVVYAQKPTNGLGDLTFTRASDATRTNSAGVIERTPWNLFTQSVWTGGGLNVAPTGWTSNFTTADFAPSTTTNGDVSYRFYGTAGRRFLSQGVSVIAGQQYRLSVYVNSVTTAVQISSMIAQIGVSTTNTKYYIDNVEVSAGTIVNTACRIAISFDVTTTGTAGFRIGGGVSANSTHDFVLSQPQVVEGLTMKPYFATTNRQDVPRLHYRNADGTVSTCPRLLLEPQRTNSIRNSTMVGAVAGSPGTLPTNWGSATGGLTQTIVGLGTENGLQYIDVRLNGTATGGSSLISIESPTGITAATGQTWTNTSYIKVISAPNPPISYNLYLVQRASGSNVGTFTQVFSPTNQLVRYSQTATISIAGVTSIQPYLFTALTNGATYDFTIRIAAPQMELGAYATTFIPTTTAAVTRLADAASKTGVSSLIGQAEGTIFLDFQSDAIDDQNYAFAIANGNANRVMLLKTASNRISATINTLNVSQCSIVSGPVTANTRYKCAIAYKKDDIAFYINGVQVGTDNLADIPSMTDIRFDSGAGSAFFRPVNQAAIFPVRLTNAQLVTLTT